jgi:hypothetical protein
MRGGSSATTSAKTSGKKMTTERWTVTTRR